jgi:O-antigen/teichoic acid export membrane protein
MIPIYTRYLLPADYGVLALLDMAMNVMGMLVGLGMGAGLIRFFHHFETQEEKNEVFTTVLITVVVLNTGLLILLQTFSTPITALVTGDVQSQSAFQLMFISLVMQNIYQVGESLLLARKQSVLYSSLAVITMLLNLSLNILFLVVFHLGVYGIMLSMLIAKSVNALIVLTLTLKGVRLRFSWAKLVRIIRFSYPLLFVSIGAFLMHYSDRIFIRAYGDLTELGLYSLGHKFGMILSMLIVTPIFHIWNTQRFEIAKQDHPKPVFARMFTYFALVVVFFGLGISVFIDEAIVIAGSAFHEAAQVVPLIVLGYIFFAFAGFMNLGCMITGKTKFLAVSQAIAVGINLLLNYFLVSRYGIMGAAMATALSFFCLALMNFIVSQKTYPVVFEYRRLALLTLAAGTAFFVSTLGDFSLLPSLAYKTGSMLVLPVGLLVFGFFNAEEKRKALELVAALKVRLLQPKPSGIR